MFEQNYSPSLNYQMNHFIQNTCRKFQLYLLSLLSLQWQSLDYFLPKLKPELVAIQMQRFHTVHNLLNQTRDQTN